MRITIAIPTYNRSRELRPTLAGLSRVNRPDGVSCEVLVIDNNSSDATPDVVAEFEPLFDGALRRVVEVKQGLCHARNRAIAESTADVIAFLDDDVDVDRGWLVALADAHRPGEHAVIGGKSYLVFPEERPTWLGPIDEEMLSKVDLGPVAKPARPEQVFGLNLSVRRSWLDRAGWFRTDLDRVGDCLLSGGDIELVQRIAAKGGNVWYDPAVLLGHRVAPERLKYSWFVRRHYWGLRSEIRQRRKSRRRAAIAALREVPGAARHSLSLAYRGVRHRGRGPEVYQRALWAAISWATLIENLRTAVLRRESVGETPATCLQAAAATTFRVPESAIEVQR